MIVILEYFGISEEQEGWSANDKMAATGCKMAVTQGFLFCGSRQMM
jgi:hypothetical protein